MAIFIDMAWTKQTGRLVKVTDLHIVERHQAMVRGPSRHRHHRRTRYIAVHMRDPQVLPPIDVQVAHPEGVQSPEAPVGHPKGRDPLAPGPSRRRPHRRTKDIAASTRGPQVPPPTDV